jgi:hypothetical protein
LSHHGLERLVQSVLADALPTAVQHTQLSSSLQAPKVLSSKQ